MKKVGTIIFLCLLAGCFSLAQAQPNCPDGTILDNGICIPDSEENGLPDPAGGVAGVITSVMLWILSIFAALAIIGFVISGIQYLLSAGDDKLMQTAKRNMIYCIIGVVVGIGGYVIIQAIDAALNGSDSF